MRLWSINPCYLDAKGLVACWREALQAQSVLLKREYGQCIKGYNEHDFCVYNSLTKKIHCCNCGNPKIKTSYWNHPQLKRFKETKYPIFAISEYLIWIYAEGKVRGYNFDCNKIKEQSALPYQNLTVTKGQLEYEFLYLQKKLMVRCPNKYLSNAEQNLSKEVEIKPNPIFKVIDGQVESWEKIK